MTGNPMGALALALLLAASPATAMTAPSAAPVLPSSPLAPTSADEDSLLGLARLLSIDHLARPAVLHSAILDTRGSADILPARYASLAAASTTPLRDALLAWNEALRLEPAERFAADPRLLDADALSHDAQIGAATLLYALTDATLAQRRAVSGLSASEYTTLLDLPARAAAGHLDLDTPGMAAEAARLAKVAGKVDLPAIVGAGQLVAAAIDHAMPALQAWADGPDSSALRLLQTFLAESAPQPTGPDAALARLEESLVLAAGLAGAETTPRTTPPRPDAPGPQPLARVAAGLAGLAAQPLPPDAAARAAALPVQLQEALALVLGAHANLLALGVGPEGETPATPATAQAIIEGHLAVAAAVRQAAPTLEAWGLVWAHHGPPLPALPQDRMAFIAGLPPAGARPSPAEVLAAAASLHGAAIPEVEPAQLPPRGGLADAVAATYAVQGIDLDDRGRARLREAALELPPQLERNVARMLYARLQAAALLENAYASIGDEGMAALSNAPDVESLLAGSLVTVTEVDALRSAYAASDELRDAHLHAAALMLATMQASADGIREEAPPPRPKIPWIARLWNAIDVVGSVQAQGPPSDLPFPVECPSGSPLADCDNDVWFADPILGTIIVSGVRTTRYDPELLTPPGAPPNGQRLTLDLGGDDVYTNNAGGATMGVARQGASTDLGTAVAVALDLGGNDRYHADARFPGPRQGAAWGGVGMLLDLGGDDEYDATVDAQGFAGPRQAGPGSPCGQGGCATAYAVGLLHDASGNDRYKAAARAQGAASATAQGGCPWEDSTAPCPALASTFPPAGIGILHDSAGDDQYALGQDSVGQGGASGAGVGLLVDAAGNDRYSRGSQGQGSTATAVGALLDLGGTDDYSRQPASRFRDDSCWVSLRSPRGNPLEQPGQGPFYGELVEPKPFTGGGPGVFADVGTAGCSLDGGDLLPEGLGLEGLDDSDGDGWPDIVEDTAGTDRQDPNDYPAGLPSQPLACSDVPAADPAQPPPPPQVCDPLDTYPPPATAGLIGHGSPYLLRIAGVLAIGDALDTIHPAATATDPGRDYLASIDLAGNDVYRNRLGGILLDQAAPTATLWLPALALDVGSGDDLYDSAGRCVQGCNGQLLDLGGHDTYLATHVGTIAAPGAAQGAVIGLGATASEVGLGLLFDASGNDTYQASLSNQVAQGSAGGSPQAIAILLDVAGDDQYRGPGQALIDTPDLAGALGGQSVGLFLDLAGNDRYQPAETQGLARYASANCGTSCRSGDVAAFADAGGWDKYLGTRAHPDGPDRSTHLNNRSTVRHQSTSQPSESIFVDQDVRAGSHIDDEGTAQVVLPTQGVLIGGKADDYHDVDWALLLDPGGNDTYANNAGGSLLRGAAHEDGSQAANFPYRDQSVDLGPDRAFPVAALLLDLGGDDRYLARPESRPLLPSTAVTTGTPSMPGIGTFAGNTALLSPATAGGILVQGSGLLGVGALVDTQGDDRYEARGFAQGAAILGVGLLWDRGGHDVYSMDARLTRDVDLSDGVAAWSEVQDGQWRVRAGRPGAPSCLVTPLATRGAAGEPAVKADGASATVVLEVEDVRTGLTRLQRATFEPPSAGTACPAVGLVQVTNQASNQRSPRLTQHHLVWEDDRLGDPDLFFRGLGAGSDAINDRPLVRGAGSRQVAPDVHGSTVVWQDDRSGSWAVHAIDLGNLLEARLSPVIPGQVRDDQAPRVSGAFVVWQTRLLLGDGSWGDWDVQVLNRLQPLGNDNPRILNKPGDQVEPDVSGNVVLFTDLASQSPTLNRYFWDTHQAVPERPSAAGVSIDRAQSVSYAWIAQAGTPGTAARPSGSPYLEVMSGQVARPGATRLSQLGDRVENRGLQGAAWFGGLGLLLEEAGNDRFTAGASSQGAAFTTGSARPSGAKGSSQASEHGTHGVLATLGGHDQFVAQSYSQGAHVGAELRQDLALAVFQGQPGPLVYVEAAHDLGLLLSLRGNNVYAANERSQGFGAFAVGGKATAGVAPAQDPRAYLVGSYGVLVDAGGRDRYLAPLENAAQFTLGPGECQKLPADPALTAVLEACRSGLEALASPKDDDRIWFQGTRRDPAQGLPATTAACPSPGTQTTDCLVVVGGLGFDASLLDRSEGPIGQAGSELLAIDIEAYRQTPSGPVPVSVLEGEALIVARVTPKTAVEPDVQSVEFYLAGPAGEEFVGYGLPASPESRDYRLAFDTAAGHVDGDYVLRVRATFGPSATEAGFVDASRTLPIDNPPRLEGADVSERWFSPFPFASDAPAHPTASFTIPPQPNTPQGHGWAEVVVKQGNTIVATPRPLGPVVAPGFVAATWNGLGDGQAPLPPGQYDIVMRATDRLDSGQPAADRTDEMTVSVRLDSMTPRRGCISLASDPPAACNVASSINTQNSKGATAADVVVRMDHDGEGFQRMHLFTQLLGNPAQPWESVPIGDLEDTAELSIPDGAVMRAVALVEDLSGNLECHPTCLGPAGAAPVSPAERAAALEAARDRKVMLGNFPDGAATVAVFAVDIERPTILIDEGPLVHVDGRTYNLDELIRAGPASDVRITFLVEKGLYTNPPTAILDWTSLSGASALRRTDNTAPLAPETSTPHRFPFTWGDDATESWADLVSAPAPWPEGAVYLTLDAVDAAGNRPEDSFQQLILLDRSPPAIHGSAVVYCRSVEAPLDCPAGRHHAELPHEGQTEGVILSIDAADPLIVGGFPHCKADIRMQVDASPLVRPEVLGPLLDQLASYREAHADDAACTNSCFGAPLLHTCYHQQSDRFLTRIPIDPPPGLEDAQGLPVGLEVSVMDSVGNLLLDSGNLPTVDVVVGPPGLGIGQPTVKPKVGGAEIHWTTAKPARASLHYGLSPDELDQTVGPGTLGTSHSFNLTGLVPGATYFHQLVAIAPSGALEAALEPFPSFRAMYGVNVTVEAPLVGARLSGVSPLAASTTVAALPGVHPSVRLTLHDDDRPSNPERILWDAVPTNGRVRIDLVTDALPDGNYTLRGTADHDGEAATVAVEALVLDNTPPTAAFLEPPPNATRARTPERLLVRVGDTRSGIDAGSFVLRIEGIPVPVESRFHPDPDGRGGVLVVEGLPPLPRGPARLLASIEDGAGNPSSALAVVHIDPDAPESHPIAVLYPNGQEAARNGQVVRLLVQPSDVGTVRQVTADLTPLGGPPSIQMVPGPLGWALDAAIGAHVTEGNHNVTVAIEDVAGNLRLLHADITIDMTPPAVAIASMLPAGMDRALLDVVADEPVAIIAELSAAGRPTVRGELPRHTSPSLLLRGLSAGATYNLTIEAIDRAGNRATQSTTWVFRPSIVAPPVAEQLEALTWPNPGVLLSWSVPPGMQDVLEFVVHRSDGGTFRPVAATRAPTFHDADVLPGWTYRYYVQAVNLDGEPGPPSAVVEVVPMPARHVAVSFTPSVGVAERTQFAFQADISHAASALPSVWLILDDRTYRMNPKDPNSDCRSSCSFVHETRLPALGLANPQSTYRVEMLDGPGPMARWPAEGSQPGPDVVTSPQPGIPAAGSLASLFAVVAALLIASRRRRSP